MILITSLGEFDFIFYCHFLFISYIKKKREKKNSAAGSLLFLCFPVFTFATGIHFQLIKNSRQAVQVLWEN